MKKRPNQTLDRLDGDIDTHVVKMFAIITFEQTAKDSSRETS